MEKITYNQFIFASLLKFDSIDNIDLLMMIRILEINNFDTSEEINSSKYIKCFGNGRLTFNWERIYEDYDDNKTFKLAVEKYCGEKVIQMLNNLDISLLTLMKFRFYDFVSLNDISSVFNALQLEEIKKLLDKKYLFECFEGLSVYDEDRVIKITKRGELYTFLIDNRIHVEYFRKLLIDNGYDDSLIETYLITQDLDNGSVIEIFKLETFLEFCDNFDILPYKTDEEKRGNSRKKTPFGV